MTYKLKAEKIASKKYSGLKQRALSDKSFNWKKIDFVNWYIAQEKACFYCKVPEKKLYQFYKLTKSKRYGTRGRSLEIDRKVDKSYSAENCCLCCYWCNNAKSDVFLEEQFLKIGKAIGETILSYLVQEEILESLKKTYPYGLSAADYDDIVVVVKDCTPDLSLTDFSRGEELFEKMKDFYKKYHEENFDVLEKFKLVLIDRIIDKEIQK